MADEENVHRVRVKPSFVLIAIDTHPSMFVKTEKQDGIESSPFQDCLRACHKVTDTLLQRKHKNFWSPIAVLLAGNETITLVDFQDITLDSVKLLNDKKSLSNGKLADDYQRNGTVDLGMFFLACKKKFIQIGSDFYKRTLIFITNDDEPTGGDEDQKFTALNEVRNFTGDQIDFEMVTMKATFDYSLFYNELFSLLKMETCENLIKDSDGLADKLTHEIRMRRPQYKGPDGHKVVYYSFGYDLASCLKRVRNKPTNKAQLFNNAHVSTDGSDLQHTSKRLTDLSTAVNHGDLYEIIDARYYQVWQQCVDHNTVLVCGRKSRILNKIKSFVQLIPISVNNAKMFLTKEVPWMDELPQPARMPHVNDGDVQFENEANKKKIVNDILGKPEESFVDFTQDTDAVDMTLGSVGERFKNLSNQETSGTKREAPRKTGGNSHKKRK